jgi:5-hydroxyisourate hydrolase
VAGVSISTHVLDASAGRPAAGVRVVLDRRTDDGWDEISARDTDADGRVPDLSATSETGVYRLTFDVANRSTFFPEVVIVFRITEAGAHHHVPLLLSPFAYSTYRGS